MSRVETLIEGLESVTQVYYAAVQTTVQKVLGHDLPSCEGHCGRVVYPKDQWKLIPAEYRVRLNKWIIEHAGFGLCPACYRSAVRNKSLSPVPRSSILSTKELEYLRRQVGITK